MTQGLADVYKRRITSHYVSLAGAGIGSTLHEPLGAIAEQNTSRSTATVAHYQLQHSLIIWLVRHAVALAAALFFEQLAVRFAA